MKTLEFKIKVDSETGKVVTLKKEFDGLVNTVTKTSNNLNRFTAHISKMINISAGLYVADKAFETLKTTIKETVVAGIELNKTLEDAKNGIAALITANTTGGSAFNRFNIAVKMSGDILNKLRLASIKTAATFPELTDIFQNSIGDAISAGKSFGKDLDSIINNTIKLDERISNIANAIGMPMWQVNQEVRSILEGTITADSRIAKMLGITNEEINKAKQNAGGLTEYLNQKLAAFDVLANTKTLSKAFARVEESIDNVRIATTKPMFNDLKKQLDNLNKWLNDNQENIVYYSKVIYFFFKKSGILINAVFVQPIRIAFNTTEIVIKKFLAFFADKLAVLEKWLNGLADKVNHLAKYIHLDFRIEKSYKFAKWSKDLNESTLSNVKAIKDAIKQMSSLPKDLHSVDLEFTKSVMKDLQKSSKKTSEYLKNSATSNLKLAHSTQTNTQALKQQQHIYNQIHSLYVATLPKQQQLNEWYVQELEKVKQIKDIILRQKALKELQLVLTSKEQKLYSDMEKAKVDALNNQNKIYDEQYKKAQGILDELLNGNKTKLQLLNDEYTKKEAILKLGLSGKKLETALLLLQEEKAKKLRDIQTKAHKQAIENFKKEHKLVMDMLDDTQNALQSTIFDFLEGKFKNLGDMLKSLFKGVASSIAQSSSKEISNSIMTSVKNAVIKSSMQSGAKTAISGSAKTLNAALGSREYPNSGKLTLAARMKYGAYGAAGGYTLGFLGDNLTGSHTRAGQYGAIGGAVGGVAFGPAGAVVGASLGAVIGGFFAKWKTTFNGIVLDSATTVFSDFSDISNLTIKNKKTWFHHKTKTITESLNQLEQSALKDYFYTWENLYDNLSGSSIQIANMIVNQGKYTQKTLQSVFARELLAKYTGNTKMYDMWAKYAKKTKQDVDKAIFEAFSNLLKFKQDYQVWLYKINGSNTKSLQFQKEILNRQLEELKQELGAANVTTDNYLQLMDKAIKASPDPTTMQKWQNLGQALEQATQAEQDYQQSLQQDLNNQSSFQEYLLSLNDELQQQTEDYFNNLIGYFKDLSQQTQSFLDSWESNYSSSESYPYYLQRFNTVKNQVDTALANGNTEDAQTYYSQLQDIAGYLKDSAPIGDKTDLLNNIKNVFSNYKDTFDTAQQILTVQLTDDQIAYIRDLKINGVDAHILLDDKDEITALISKDFTIKVSDNWNTVAEQLSQGFNWNIPSEFDELFNGYDWNFSVAIADALQSKYGWDDELTDSVANYLNSNYDWSSGLNYDNVASALQSQYDWASDLTNQDVQDALNSSYDWSSDLSTYVAQALQSTYGWSDDLTSDVADYLNSNYDWSSGLNYADVTNALQSQYDWASDLTETDVQTALNSSYDWLGNLLDINNLIPKQFDWNKDGLIDAVSTVMPDGSTQLQFDWNNDGEVDLTAIIGQDGTLTAIETNTDALTDSTSYGDTTNSILSALTTNLDTYNQSITEALNDGNTVSWDELWTDPSLYDKPDIQTILTDLSNAGIQVNTKDDLDNWLTTLGNLRFQGLSYYETLDSNTQQQVLSLLDEMGLTDNLRNNLGNNLNLPSGISANISTSDFDSNSAYGTYTLSDGEQFAAQDTLASLIGTLTLGNWNGYFSNQDQTELAGYAQNLPNQHFEVPDISTLIGTDNWNLYNQYSDLINQGLITDPDTISQYNDLVTQIQNAINVQKSDIQSTIDDVNSYETEIVNDLRNNIGDYDWLTLDKLIGGYAAWYSGRHGVSSWIETNDGNKHYISLNYIDEAMPAINTLNSLEAYKQNLITDKNNAYSDILNNLQFFADGGIVDRPTLGMVGEAGYPEAIIPMPKGYIPIKIERDTIDLSEIRTTNTILKEQYNVQKKMLRLLQKFDDEGIKCVS